MQLGKFSILLGCAVGLFCGHASRLLAENWPQWRGPNSTGISTEKNLPVEWDKDTNVAWKLPLPGAAGATPCVWEDSIFVTTPDKDDRLVLLCVGTDGKERWRRVIVESGNRKVRNDEGNMASPSPATDGELVWVMMGTGDIACFDFEGKEIWKFNLQDRYGKFNIAFGMASTPVLHGGRLFVQLIHGDGKAATQEAMVVALDKATGKEAWKADRVTGASNENEHSYASPMLYDDGKTEYLITHGADYTIAYNLQDGTERWRLEGLNPHTEKYHKTLRFVASPVANDGLVVVPTAKRGPVAAIDGNARGVIDDESPSRVWTMRQNTPDVPSPLILDGLVYLCRENGNLMCLDAKTGEEYYEQRTHVDRHRASPVYADGKLYLSARDGTVSVVKTGKEFELLAQNKLDGEISASPAIANGTIYLRTFDALWAIRK